MATKRVSATVTTFIAVGPELAFAVFTEEIDSWWRQGPRYRSGKPGSSKMTLEPKLGGRLSEIYGDTIFALGTIMVWEPPRHLVLEWNYRNSTSKVATEVEITFEAIDDGTQVTIEHRGVHELPADDPAVHGLSGGALSAMIGSWWSDLATTLRLKVVERSATK